MKIGNSSKKDDFLHVGQLTGFPIRLKFCLLQNVQSFHLKKKLNLKNSSHNNYICKAKSSAAKYFIPFHCSFFFFFLRICIFCHGPCMGWKIIYRHDRELAGLDPESYGNSCCSIWSVPEIIYPVTLIQSSTTVTLVQGSTQTLTFPHLYFFKSRQFKSAFMRSEFDMFFCYILQ